MCEVLKPVKATGDLVLQEVWRAKDTLSAAYGPEQTSNRFGAG